MSIYSMNISNVSRAGGSSSCATLSYITSQRVRDERLGETYNGFGRRERVRYCATMLPEGAPSEYANPEALFNGIELAEKAANARTAKKIMVALPKEFDLSTQNEVIERFVRDNLTSRGYAATYAIHCGADGHNPHAHILVANRRIDPKSGKWAAKRVKEYVLDEDGQRVPVIDPKTGTQKVDKRGRRQWKRRDAYRNPLDGKDMLQAMRASWAETCNRYLPDVLAIDHRSNEARGIEAIPTTHEGYAAREIEARGGTSERCEANREVRRINQLLTRLRDELRELGQRISQAMRTAREQARPTVDSGKAELFSLLGLTPAQQQPPVPQTAQEPQQETPQMPEPERPKKTRADVLNLLDKRVNERLEQRSERVNEAPARSIEPDPAPAPAPEPEPMPEPEPEAPKTPKTRADVLKQLHERAESRAERQSDMKARMMDGEEIEDEELDELADPWGLGIGFDLGGGTGLSR